MGIVLDAMTGVVQNGSAFEKAVFEIPSSVRTLHVPDDAKVELVPGEGQIEIYLQKVLAYTGLAPAMSIVDHRHRLGIAYQHDRALLTLATHGVWSRHNAGGPEIRVLLRVPVGLEVEHRPMLSGRHSEANTHPVRDIQLAVEQRGQSPEFQEKVAKLRGLAAQADPSRLQEVMQAQRELMKELYGLDLRDDDAEDDPWSDSRLRPGWRLIATELDPAHTAAAWMPTLLAEPGIVLGDQRGRVANGSAFERALVRVPAGVQVVQVPKEAAVQPIASEGRIEVYVQKVLSYYGHPAGPMSIITTRHEMGVASRQQATRLVFVTYGEWKNFEGGRHVQLFLRVPASLSVTRSAESPRDEERPRSRDDDFDGPEPPTVEVPSASRLVASKPPALDPSQWQTVATELDPDHTALQGVTPTEARMQWLASLDIRALRSALWALKSGLDQQSLAAYLPAGKARDIDLEGCLSRCLDQLSPLEADDELAERLTSGTALLRDVPRGDSDRRWAAKLQGYAHLPQLAARITARSLWASEVGDWFRSVMDLLPAEMPTADYFEGMASLADPEPASS